MARINLPSINKADLAVGVTNGGTGEQSSSASALALNLVTVGDIGKANGPVALDANGQISPGALPSGPAANGVSINSTFTVITDQVLTLKISDYDSFKTYSVSVSAGSFTRVGDTIYYTAPSTAQTTIITINGRALTVEVTAIKPRTPTITSPVNNATGLSYSVSITSDAFVSVGDTSTHASSDWQLATDAAFTTIVASSMADIVNKTSWTVTAPTVSTKYYARVRYNSSAGKVSDWSSVSAFTTKATNTTWAQEAKLLASDAAANDYFGWSVSISADGSRVAIGAYNKNGERGAAYIFSRTGSTWAQEAKLLASDAAASDYFGISVSITADGSRVAIGAYAKIGTAGAYQGAAYIFTRTNTTWTQEAKLLASDPANDYFGNSVSISADGSRVAIGAYNKNGAAGIYQGAAYIFARTGNTWTQESKLLHSDPAQSDQFGASVSITSDGSRVAIGAYYKTGTAGAQQGAAYIFTRTNTTWTQEAKLVASDPANDQFGYSVSITADGSRVVIGAYVKSGTVSGQGVVYIFTRSASTWTQEAKLLASDPVTNDQFGRSVSITADGSRVAIGANNKTGSAGSGQGATYIFK